MSTTDQFLAMPLVSSYAIEHRDGTMTRVELRRDEANGRLLKGTFPCPKPYPNRPTLQPKGAQR